MNPVPAFYGHYEADGRRDNCGIVRRQAVQHTGFHGNARAEDAVIHRTLVLKSAVTRELPEPSDIVNQSQAGRQRLAAAIPSRSRGHQPHIFRHAAAVVQFQLQHRRRRPSAAAKPRW